jgi:hypothetical protein
VDSAKLNDWMQIVGMFAIVASLIFVGLQMKQSQEIAVAAQYQTRAQTAQSMYMSLQESGTSIRVLNKTVSEMTPVERDTVENVTRWAWIHYDNIYFQYRSGFYDEESWRGMKFEVDRAFGRCDRRYIWESMRTYLRPSFVNYVEGLKDTCDSTK